MTMCSCKARQELLKQPLSYTVTIVHEIKNSDTQKYTHIKTYTHPKLTEEENDFKNFVKRLT